MGTEPALEDSEEAQQRASIVRSAFKTTAFVLFAVLLLIAPVSHYVTWAGQRVARRCLATGQTVRIERLSDVRVSTSVDNSRSQHIVVDWVSVRVGGRWIRVDDSEAGYRDRDWYTGAGVFPPLPGTRAFPPLAVRPCGGPDRAMFEQDAQRRAHSNALASWWRWSLDAVSVAIPLAVWGRVSATKRRPQR